MKRARPVKCIKCCGTGKHAVGKCYSCDGKGFQEMKDIIRQAYYQVRKK